jgi:hypothetical protein
MIVVLFSRRLELEGALVSQAATASEPVLIYVERKEIGKCLPAPCRPKTYQNFNYKNQEL